MSRLHPDGTPRGELARSCAAFVRWQMREAKGPRRGRHTFWTLACAQCGFATAERRSKRAGSRASVEDALRDELAARRCPKPRDAAPAARLLLAVAGHVRNGVGPSIPFAVEFLGDGTTPAAALFAAWRDCDSGAAMATLWHALNALHSEHTLSPYWGEDGAWCRVEVVTKGVDISLRGPDEAVAGALRRLAPLGLLVPKWNDTVPTPRHRP